MLFFLYLCGQIQKPSIKKRIMILEASPYKVFAGSQGGELAKRICEYLGCSLGNIQVARFSDGEFAVSFEESVRGQSVYIVQST